MASIVVIDYGMGNLGSIRRALEACGAAATLASDPAAASGATHLLLPGVGAFPDAMRQLEASGWAALLRALPARGGPLLLGICLGMQVLFEAGHEGAPTAGLATFAGEVRRLSPRPDERLPHVGWNGVTFRGEPHPAFAGITSGTDFYFVHSYHGPADGPQVIATCDYAGGFAAAVARGNLLGVQFHPEKSQRAGLRLLRNWIGMAPC